MTRAIIHIPAFAEEMNKSRRMVALQARALASQDYAVLVLDLFGTGESSGDFGDATWQTWLQDIDSAVIWLKQKGVQTIDLWGSRTGALLAMNFATDPARQAIGRLLCWQPVLSGETFVTQFLRLRIAAAMMDPHATKEKTSDLKRQLIDRQTIEVAGYLLNPDLIVPLMKLRAEHFAWQSGANVVLFELVPSEESSLSAVNTNFLLKLQEQGVETSLTKVIGEPFWSTQEISEEPDLIQATSSRIRHNCSK